MRGAGLIQRREFLHKLGVGLAGAWALGHGLRPRPAAAAVPSRRLAFLADAHLVDGGEGRGQARALARTVAELRALRPAPDLVLFAGDLADNGHPAALALGKEILSDLPAPVLMLMGEGDAAADGGACWRRLFGKPWFSYSLPPTPQAPPPPDGDREHGSLPGPAHLAHSFPKTETPRQKTLQVIGLHTAMRPGPGEPGFRVGAAGRRWLGRRLAGLDPDSPLLLLSHAPLDLIYRPWQQWTQDGPEVLALLRPFREILCLHAHTHWGGVRGQGSEVGQDDACDQILLTANEKRQTKNRLISVSLPATSWPRPQALQGTPATPVPGLGPRGCGWLLLAAGPSSSHHWQAQIWQS